MIAVHLGRHLRDAIIDAGAAATTEVVAAVAGKKIRVWGYLVGVGGAAGTFKFQSDSGGTPVDLTGTIPAAINSIAGVMPPAAPVFETGAGKNLAIVMAGAGATGDGHLLYELV